MHNLVMRKISHQLTFVVLIALALVASLYFFLQPLCEKEICNYYDANPQITQKKKAQALISLQSFVNDRDVAAVDVDQLSQWIKRESLTIISIRREGKTLFDSTHTADARLHTHARTHDATTLCEVTYPLVFADGVAYVSVTVFPEHRVIHTINSILVAVCGVIFLTILLVSIRKKLALLTRLEREVLTIAGGELEGQITIQGQDELSRLAECIDEMRNSLVMKLHQEEVRQQEHYELVTSLSHDLRTPLTSLTGYLELMRRANMEPAQTTYVEKAIGKAEQLKDMSDILFACFSPHAMQADALRHMPAEMLHELLEERAHLLRAEGYAVEVGAAVQGSLYVQPMALQRVLDNVLSNLTKYADRKAPISMDMQRVDRGVQVRIVSRSGDSRQVPSAGLGLGICANLMANMQGHMETSAQGDLFVYLLAWQAENG